MSLEISKIYDAIRKDLVNHYNIDKPDDLIQFLKDKKIKRFMNESFVVDYAGRDWINLLVKEHKLKKIRILTLKYYIVVDDHILLGRKRKLRKIKCKFTLKVIDKVLVLIYLVLNKKH